MWNWRALFQKKTNTTAALPDNASTQNARRTGNARIAPRRPPVLTSIGNVRWTVPPSRAFTVSKDNRGGGGPGNAGAFNVQKNPVRIQSQPSWHYESNYEFFGAARPSSTPHLAGIRANDFRTLGDTLGARQ